MIPDRFSGVRSLARIPTATTARFPSSTPRPTATVLVISISAVAPNIPEYDRVAWKHWTDSDGDCRNTRQQVLAGESVTPVTFETDRKCRIEAGRWYGAFTGNYEKVPDIDHIVPLKNAHNSGGWAWTPAKKVEYANYLDDPDHLIAVTARANRSKGDKGPEDWKPPDETYWCQYATDWTEIKARWGLTMTQTEAETVLEMVSTCENHAEVVARRVGAVPRPTAEPAVPEHAEKNAVYSFSDEAAGRFP